ncbi:hypothetical protein KY290_024630 [Solanum tuberosum]|uniref:Uncharacterized protein n=1 Tax=Solanum tuberosum TaxID=4113 RepID=A0ABQ7UUD1_SOLTU|nr:hypothetical protein KY284_023476 [Solanum tuberosum]KAH0754360.1 hypothetical protein KY290_024630 [Solanum tuberosum]
MEDRKMLWQDPREIHMNQQGAWLALGDYNAILDSEDRIIGNLVREMEIVDFNEFLLDSSIIEMRSRGRSFTWTNRHISRKIDRVLVNGEWMLMFPQLEVHVMDPKFPDHSPLRVQIAMENYEYPKPFRFLNCIVDHEEFLGLCRECGFIVEEKGI